MTTMFVGRHQGTLAWIRRQPIVIDRYLDEFRIECVRPGDTVIGTLPVDLAAEVCERGARFIAVVMDIPKIKRGLELSEKEVEECRIRLRAFHVEKGEFFPETADRSDVS